MGVRVTPDLVTLGSVFVATRPKKETYPAAVYNGTDYFLVWGDMNIGGDTTNFYIVTSRVSPAGVVLDTPSVLSTALGPVDSNNGRIGFDGARCLAVWNNTAGAVYGRFIASSGQPDGNSFTINTSGGSRPDIAFDGTNYLVVWHNTSYDIIGQLVSPLGQLVGSKITIAASSDLLMLPRVIHDGQKYLVVWRQPEATNKLICGQFVSESGVLIGGNFIISNPTTNQKSYPVAAASDQNYLVAWHEDRSGVITDIYGNVDFSINAVEEQVVQNKPGGKLPTVFRGSLDFFMNKGYLVYDATGRRAAATRLAPGVYFLKKTDDNRTVFRKVMVIE